MLNKENTTHYTVTVSDEFVDSNRAEKALRGAMYENVKELINELSNLGLLF